MIYTNNTFTIKLAVYKAKNSNFNNKVNHTFTNKFAGWWDSVKNFGANAVNSVSNGLDIATNGIIGAGAYLGNKAGLWDDTHHKEYFNDAKNNISTIGNNLSNMTADHGHNTWADIGNIGMSMFGAGLGGMAVKGGMRIGGKMLAKNALKKTYGLTNKTYKGLTNATKSGVKARPTVMQNANMSKAQYQNFRAANKAMNAKYAPKKGLANKVFQAGNVASTAGFVGGLAQQGGQYMANNQQQGYNTNNQQQSYNTNNQQQGYGVGNNSNAWGNRFNWSSTTA